MLHTFHNQFVLRFNLRLFELRHQVPPSAPFGYEIENVFLIIALGLSTASSVGRWQLYWGYGARRLEWCAWFCCARVHS